MLWKLLKTSDDRALFLTRIVLGTVMFAHGAQKVFGWFGGGGLQPTLQMFGGRLGLPAPLASLSIAAEFLGGVGLMLGLFGRIAALGVVVNMLVAAILVHLRNGFFMNWSGSQRGEGFEYHLLALALALATLVGGSGAWSLDRVLLRRFGRVSQR